MQEHKVVITWEAIYDIADIADYIELDFGKNRADKFQSDIILKQTQDYTYPQQISSDFI